MDSKVTFMPSPNPGCSELCGNRSLVKEVFSYFLYVGSADDLGILSIKLGSLDRHVQYQDLERGAGTDRKLFYMHFKPQA